MGTAGFLPATEWHGLKVHEKVVASQHKDAHANTCSDQEIKVVSKEVQEVPGPGRT